MNRRKSMRKANDVKKGLLAGLLAVSICMAFPLHSAKANPHYDRRSTVAEEELECVPSAGASEKTEKKVSPKAWKKINGVCYNGSGVAIPGAITWGMDVSEWQGKINWTKVKNAGIDFALVRVSYGLTHMDNTYDYNMTQAELAGVPVGTYVFSTATNTETALKEAKLAISKMDGYKVSYPVVYDLEYSGMQKLSSTEISRLALTFCNEVRKAGYYPMVYCNTYWHDTYVDWSLLPGVDVWIARYGDKIQAPDADRYSYTIWQATDGNTASGLNSTKGLIPGIPAENDVDVDFGYVDYTRKITPRWKADSNYTPSVKPDQDGDSVQEPVKNGWSAATESTITISTAPDRTIVSVISNACSPLSGWDMYKLSISTAIFLAYTGSRACSASINPAIPPLFWTSATICRATVVLPLDSGP